MKTDPISAATAYRQALHKIVQTTTHHQARQLASQALAVELLRPEPGTVSIASGFGQQSGQAFVTFSLANPQEVANPTIQIGTQQARALALQILEAADAAESDGYLVFWLRDKADLNDAQCGAMLKQFRDWREHQRKLQDG